MGDTRVSNGVRRPWRRRPRFLRRPPSAHGFGTLDCLPDHASDVRGKSIGLARSTWHDRGTSTRRNTAGPEHG